MRTILKTVAVAAAIIVTGQASAAVLYSNPLLSGPIASPNTIGFTAAAPAAGPAALSFNLNGFASLDGVNAYEDDFTLSLNGATILSLSYDLGGGGANAIFANPFGATVAYSTPAVFFGGGSLQISFAALTLLSGNNVFSFAYASPSGAALGGAGPHAGPQGTGDEAWGVSNVLLSTASAVPEPATWGLMLTGFGAAGLALRNRKRNRVSIV